MKLTYLLMLTFVFVNTAHAYLSNSQKEPAYDCLASLKEEARRFSTGSVDSILLSCDDDGCPYTSGFYDAKSKSITIPLKKDGERGTMVYSANGQSHFVKLPTSGISNDEVRYVTMDVNEQKICGKYSRTYGVHDVTGVDSLNEVVADISDYFSSSYIGYNIEVVDIKKCESAPTNKGSSLISKQTRDLLHSAVRREIKSEVGSLVVGSLKEFDRNKLSLHLVVGCKPVSSEKCLVSTKTRFFKLRGILNSCVKNIKEKETRNYILDHISNLNKSAEEVGLIKKDSEECSGSTCEEGAVAN